MLSNKEDIMRNDFLAHHGILGQKWGVKNGPPYPLNSDKLATKIHNEAVKNEPKITKDVTEAANRAGSNMYGLEHKLKTRESTSRKIRTDSEEKRISEFESAVNIKDAVRYTTISSDNNFVDSYNKFKETLEDKGYSETRCRNYFEMYREGKVKHKSVQSVFKTPDGYSFEVQFQTPSSQSAKDKKIPLYEERRKPGLSKERQLELEDKMDELAKQVTDPKDIYKIKSHN